MRCDGAERRVADTPTHKHMHKLRVSEHLLCAHKTRRNKTRAYWKCDDEKGCVQQATVHETPSGGEQQWESNLFAVSGRRSGPALVREGGGLPFLHKSPECRRHEDSGCDGDCAEELRCNDREDLAHKSQSHLERTVGNVRPVPWRGKASKARGREGQHVRSV